MARKMSSEKALRLWENTHPSSFILLEPGTAQYLQALSAIPKGHSDDLKVWANLIWSHGPTVIRDQLIEEADKAYQRGYTTSDSAQFENFMVQLLSEGRLTVDPRSEYMFGQGAPRHINWSAEKFRHTIPASKLVWCDECLKFEEKGTDHFHGTDPHLDEWDGGDD